MTLTLQSIQVATGFDEEGMLVLDEEQRLLAVLTHLSDDNEVSPGLWYLETGFGCLGGINHPAFADLEAAQQWVSQRVVDRSAPRTVG